MYVKKINPFIDINNKQTFIEYESLVPEKQNIDIYINEINKRNEPLIAVYSAWSIINYSELFELEKRLGEIRHGYVIQEIRELIKKYKVRMNKLQYYYERNMVDKLLRQINDEDLTCYVRYLNDEYGTLTESGMEVAREINIFIKQHNPDAETIKIDSKTKQR